MKNIYETERLNLQIKLDSEKSKKERNLLGQYSTPKKLADDIVISSLSLLPKNEKIRFLDPAIGTGVFFSSLIENVDSERIEAAYGYEIDSHYAITSSELWKNSGLGYIQGDFLETPCPIEKKIQSYDLQSALCSTSSFRH